MPKTKKNVRKTKIEVDNSGSIPTYSELNAFMRPSKISPLYVDNSSDDEQDIDDDYSSRTSSSSSSSSNQSQISDSLYDVDIGSDSENENQNQNETIDALSSTNDIAENDKNIYNMKCILEKKRLMLLHKNREVKELVKQNSFLNNVLSDYEKIKSNILEEKRKQQDAIKIISKHISRISKNMNEEDYHVEQLQDDQNLLLQELEKIKMEMKEVMQS
jgi:hypothetical protein